MPHLPRRATGESICRTVVSLDRVDPVPAATGVQQTLIPVSYTHLDVYKRQVYENTAALQKAMKAQERLLHQFEQLDGPRYESRVKETLVALGLDQARWSTLTEHLSGGQKKLIMLAKLLVQRCV